MYVILTLCYTGITMVPKNKLCTCQSMFKHDEHTF